MHFYFVSLIVISYYYHHQLYAQVIPNLGISRFRESCPPAPTTPIGEDGKPMGLLVQVKSTGKSIWAAPAAVPHGFLAGAGREEWEAFPWQWLGPFYLSSGTTEEVLCKLGKQWDVLVLMGVKMKNVKGSILTCVSRARLEESPAGHWLCVCAQLCPTLCDPLDCNLPGSSVYGISQARILKQVAFSYSRGSSQPRDWTHASCVSCTAGGFFTTEPS